MQAAADRFDTKIMKKTILLTCKVSQEVLVKLNCTALFEWRGEGLMTLLTKAPIASELGFSMQMAENVRCLSIPKPDPLPVVKEVDDADGSATVEINSPKWLFN